MQTFGADRRERGQRRDREGFGGGLIGTNGAGKTTFINMITGYIKPDRGSIAYEGRDITALPPRDITRLGICRSFQIPQLYRSAWACSTTHGGPGHRAA